MCRLLHSCHANWVKNHARSQLKELPGWIVQCLGTQAVQSFLKFHRPIVIRNEKIFGSISINIGQAGEQFPAQSHVL